LSCLIAAGWGEASADPLPDGVVMYGTGEIARAWLTRPTRRYDHGILGDDIEAGGMAVELRNGRRLEVVLAENRVFEDRRARIADLDGDGSDEIVVVETDLARGAALAVYGLKGDALQRLAATPAIGRSHRWLNPAAIADLDGDGGAEIAIVVTPHIGGRVQIWQYRRGSLRKRAEKNGYSNHAIGSREQELAAVVRLADGRAALALPDQQRRLVAVLVFSGDRLQEIARIDAGGIIAGPVQAIARGRSISVRLQGGRRNVLPVP
jgi:hypothetical protein